MDIQSISLIAILFLLLLAGGVFVVMSTSSSGWVREKEEKTSEYPVYEGDI